MLYSLLTWRIQPRYKNISNPDIWERVKPSGFPDGQKPQWMTFDDSWVDEVHRGLKASKVLCWYPLLCMTLLSLVQNQSTDRPRFRAWIQPDAAQSHKPSSHLTNTW